MKFNNSYDMAKELLFLVMQIVVFRLFVLDPLEAYVVVTVAENVTDLNITVCGSNTVYSVGVFYENLTWFQAQEACIVNGYDHLDAAETYRPRRTHLRQILETSTNMNTQTFWMDWYRPDFHYADWFTTTCKERDPDLLSVQPKDDELCSVVYFNKSESDFQTRIIALPANCHNRHFYTCHKNHGEPTFYVYENFNVKTVPIFRYFEVKSVQSLDQCIQLCVDKFLCPFVVFNRTTPSCSYFTPLSGYSAANVTIVAVNSNVTFAAKTDCVYHHFNSSGLNTSVINDTFTTELNRCEKVTSTTRLTTTNLTTLSTLTPSVCSCNESKITKEEFDEMVARLTVSKSLTSSYRRSKVSAEDHRTEAKVVGALGVIVLVIIFSLPVLSDMLTFSSYLLKSFSDSSSSY